MSFSSDTKNDILSELPSKICCKKSLLMGILTFSNIYNRDKIKIVTENKCVADTVCKLLTELYGVNYHCEMSIKSAKTEEGADKVKYNSYKIILNERSEIGKLSELFSKDSISLYRINTDVFEPSCSKCVSVFMRGAFLSAGTVSRPESSFHLEISSSRKNLIFDTVKLLEENGLSPHVTQRNSSTVVYFKKCDDIADFLGFIGASSASFSYINESIIRESRSLANRAVNCDTANIKKTLSAASQTLSAIKYIIDSGMLDKLPSDLKKTALLRYDNPHATLNELSEMSDPKLTKSGINHRLKRLMEYAKNLGQE